jgi:hypothetical protein
MMNRTSMTADSPAVELDRLASLVRRLRPSFRDAEEFYLLRSEVTGGLLALGRRLGYAHPPPPPLSPPVTKIVTATINGFNRRCPGCDGSFHTVQSKQTHCSGRCRMRVYRRRCRARAAGAATGAPAAGPLVGHPAAP